MMERGTDTGSQTLLDPSLARYDLIYVLVTVATTPRTSKGALDATTP
jgi:hypothetical protein